jgi:hypothetical protein
MRTWQGGDGGGEGAQAGVRTCSLSHWSVCVRVTSSGTGAARRGRARRAWPRGEVSAPAIMAAMVPSVGGCSAVSSCTYTVPASHDCSLCPQTDRQTDRQHEYVCTYVCMYVCVRVVLCVSFRVCVCACVVLCARVCMYVCVCTYVCVYVCLYVCPSPWLCLSFSVPKPWMGVRECVPRVAACEAGGRHCRERATHPRPNEAHCRPAPIPSTHPHTHKSIGIHSYTHTHTNIHTYPHAHECVRRRSCVRECAQRTERQVWPIRRR